MGTDTGFSSAARFLLVAAAFVIVVAGMQAAASLIAPFLLAVLSPSSRLRRCAPYVGAGSRTGPHCW